MAAAAEGSGKQTWCAVFSRITLSLVPCASFYAQHRRASTSSQGQRLVSFKPDRQTLHLYPLSLFQFQLESVVFRDDLDDEEMFCHSGHPVSLASATTGRSLQLLPESSPAGVLQLRRR